MSSSPGPRTEAGQVRGSAPGAARRPSSAPTERIRRGQWPARDRRTRRALLWLTTETLFVEHGFRHADEVRIAALRLDFAYGASRVRSSDPCRHVFNPARMDEGPIPRDAAAETQARRVLESFGAIELEPLDDAAVTPGADVDYVVRARRRRPRAVRVLGVRGAAAARAGLARRDRPRLPVAGRRRPSAAVRRGRARRRAPRLVRPRARHRDRRPPRRPAAGAARAARPEPAASTALARSPRRCVAVQVDDKRWLPVPPERLAAHAREGARRAVPRRRASCALPAIRAPLSPSSCAALHDEHAAAALGRRHARSATQAYALALGPRTRRAPSPRRRARARRCARTSARASPGCSTCARTAPAACSPTTWASARRCRRSPTCWPRRRRAGSIARRWSSRRPAWSATGGASSPASRRRCACSPLHGPRPRTRARRARASTTS